MALLSLLSVVAVLCVLTLWKRLTRKDKIPAGLKKLPGPKGRSVVYPFAVSRDKANGVVVVKGIQSLALYLIFPKRSVGSSLPNGAKNSAPSTSAILPVRTTFGFLAMKLHVTCCPKREQYTPTVRTFQLSSMIIGIADNTYL